MKVNTVITVLLILLSAYPLFSQSDNSIEAQFDNIYTKSNNYQDYKVVEKVKILQLKKNTLDSINVYKSVIVQLQSEIDSQKISYDLVNGRVKELEVQLDQAIKKENELQFLGISTTKTSYSLIVWCIIAGLLFFSILFLLRYKRNNQTVKALNRKIGEIENEFDNHRQRALEREQQLSRKLLDAQKKNTKS
ncbi:MAG TPA: hypothetical protein VKZ42_01665 [Flavobacteriaceae bacterium]|nr:hypothetical protein [Flavobacteriaceae bacterium]